MPPVEMKVVWGGEKILGIVDKKMPTLMSKIGAEYTNDVKLSMRASPRGGPGVNVRGQKRSAPGEPPAPETGDLIRSIRFQVRKTAFGWVVECGSTLKYSVYLEFGAARGRVMQARDIAGKFIKSKTMSWILYPRPAWGPAILRLRAKMPSILKKFGGR
jgi:hypothetical protein